MSIFTQQELDGLKVWVLSQGVPISEFSPVDILGMALVPLEEGDCEASRSIISAYMSAYGQADENTTDAELARVAMDTLFFTERWVDMLLGEHKGVTLGAYRKLVTSVYWVEDDELDS